MDLGATICRRSKPACNACPLNSYCKAKMTNTVSLLPTPKASKTLPIKQLVFLLLSNNKKILLEKRPPTGIWGGLWSLPEFPNIHSVYDWCLTTNTPIIISRTLPTQRHTFSHYHLDYTTVLIQTDNPINFVMEADHTVWYNTQQIKTLGLPAPIKLLLKQHARG
jgi:A/G-specific adenine glycosylase